MITIAELDFRQGGQGACQETSKPGGLAMRGHDREGIDYMLSQTMERSPTGKWVRITTLNKAWKLLEWATRPPTTHEYALRSVNAKIAYLFREANLWACSAAEAAETICDIVLRAMGPLVPEGIMHNES